MAATAGWPGRGEMARVAAVVIALAASSQRAIGRVVVGWIRQRAQAVEVVGCDAR